MRASFQGQNIFALGHRHRHAEIGMDRSRTTAGGGRKKPEVEKRCGSLGEGYLGQKEIAEGQPRGCPATGNAVFSGYRRLWAIPV